MKTKPHAKVLAEAARIVGFPINLNRNSAKDVLLCFCGYCEDWLAERMRLVGRNELATTYCPEKNDWRVAQVIGPMGFTYGRHNLRHVALASAVLAVHKQETAK